jgi:hypothetical protein
MSSYQTQSLAPCDNDTLRQMINARLDYAHHLVQAEPQSIIRLEEPAYQALFDLAQGNPGHMLYAFRQVLILSSESVKKRQERPHIVTADHIRAVSASCDSYQAWQDSSIKGAVILNMGRAGLRDISLEEKLVREFNEKRE